jgi:hypothetical protein
MLLTPVANGALGYRFSLGQRGWLALRAGYGIRLRQDNVQVRGGGDLNPLLAVPIGLSQPGGVLIGLSGGFSIL